MNIKHITPFIIFVSLFFIYSYTLAPGISWANGGADGGDLITAAAINGVPHPTGYPLYMLLAKLFQYVPIGNLAYRTNLFSACCTSLASIMLYFTANHILVNKKFSIISSLVATLAFGLSPLVWSQAVIAEVYGLQSLLTIIILYQTLFWDNKTFDNLIRGMCVGLSLGNHITTIFLIPFLLIENNEIKFFSNSKLSLRILGVLLGLSVYLILPFRAMNNPEINWNDPVTFNSFFQLVSGKIYQSYFSTQFIFDRIRAWSGILIEQFGALGVFLGIFALLHNETHKKYKLPIFWIFISYGVFALFYASYDSHVYLIQTIIAFSLWIGLGFQSLISFIVPRWDFAKTGLNLLLVILIVRQVLIVTPKVDASNDNRAIEFANQVLRTSPENAIIFTGDDQSTFTLWYYHYAEKQRPDIMVVSEGLLAYEWYHESLRSNYPELSIPTDDQLTFLEIIRHNKEFPYCVIRDSELLDISCYNYD